MTTALLDLVDPVTFEVIRHRLWTINDDQARMAARLSGAPIVYEGYDFNAALVTGDGEGLYCGVYILHHGATIDSFVRRLLEEWSLSEIRPGDMFFTNDPWYGALHANDGILVMPIHSGDELVGWSGIAMHDNDVGSPVPGSFVQGAHTRFDEAPLVPAVKIAEGFELRRDIAGAYFRNSRTPGLNELNMRARMGALIATHRRMTGVIDEYGRETFIRCQAQILDYVERVLRARLLEMPDGTWSVSGFHDHDGTNDINYPLHCKLVKRGAHLQFDWTGTAPQAPGPVNCTRPAMEGAVLGAVLTALCFDLPWSIGGVRRMVDIVSEEGTINNAQDPAATSLGSAQMVLSTQDLAVNALAKMLLCSDELGSEAQASWAPGHSGGLYGGANQDGRASFAMLPDPFGGGGGARTFTDGIDSGGVMHSLAARTSNVETVEDRTPALVLFRRQLCDSGGAGRFRGGVSVESCVVPHKAEGPPGVNFACAGVNMPAGKGLSGGYPGSAVSMVIFRNSNVRDLLAHGRVPSQAGDLSAERIEVLEAKAMATLGPTDVLIGMAPPGAGFGDPIGRDPVQVIRDIRLGLVSAECAERVYGVSTRHGALDDSATRARREQIRAARLEGAQGARERLQVVPSGTVLHPVADTVEAVEVSGRRLMRCKQCHTCLAEHGENWLAHAAVRALALDQVTALNEHCDPAFVLHEYACPGCGTAFSADVEAAIVPRSTEVSLL